MQIKSQIRTTAYVVGFIWSLAIALSGLRLDGTVSKALTFVPLVLALLFSAFDQFLWRIGPLPGWIKCPDLRGTWRGTFSGEWFAEDGRINHTDGAAALVIKQTFTKTSVVLVAERSKSYSYLSTTRQHESGEYSISYEYSNTPMLKFRSSMPAHSGSATLTTAVARPKSITAEYWTNRLSRGTMEMTWVSHERASDLVTAQAIEQQDTKGRS